MGYTCGCSFGYITCSTDIVFYVGETEWYFTLSGIASIGRDNEVAAYVDKLMSLGRPMVDINDLILYVVDNDGYVNVNAALLAQGLVTMLAVDKPVSCRID